MKILGIDTSCDDTCVALLKANNSCVGTVGHFKLLSNVVSSQEKLHAKYGGVYPFLAKREHQKNLPAVFKKALRDPASLMRPGLIDLIGVTVGPGLEPCLWQGVNFAKELAKKIKKPLILVNHLEAHILVNFIRSPSALLQRGRGALFPAVCLVVSGGHTRLILMKGIGKYQLIGETRDDAAGECFDKVARILGLGYPGGPVIAAKAKKFSRKQPSVRLPRPMIYQKNYDFSFSGLKTAVLYNHRTQSPKIRSSRNYIQEMCFEVQQAIVDVLIHKTLKAVKDSEVKTIILGGGVAANIELREQLKEKIEKEIPNITYHIPDPKFCTDNAAMIAITAYLHRKEKVSRQNIEANANLSI